MNNPVLFLDIDGVLNPESHPVLSLVHEGFVFHPKAVNYLKKILNETNAFLVISSTWRIGRTLEEVKEIFSHYQLDSYIQDMTPFLDWDATRGDEIKAYLMKRPDIKHFLILDDDRDIDPFSHAHIWVNPLEGITEDVYKDMVNKLNQT